VEFRNEYYMFVKRSLGYWHSADLQNWNFINHEKWYFEGSNTPAAFNYKDSVLYVTGNPSGSMSMLLTDNPKKGDWKVVPSILNSLQDPCFFIDEMVRPTYSGAHLMYIQYEDDNWIKINETCGRIC